MKYEIENTLKSCLPPYQKEVSLSQYNIFVIDNGSSDDVQGEFLESLAHNITYVRVPFDTKSPATSMNWAIHEFGSSDLVMICIDGARMFSSQIISKVFDVYGQISNAFVYTLGFHIGDKTHMKLSQEGYTIEQARKFLESINWYNEPNLLLENSVFAGSSRNGYFSSIAESNAFVVRREDLFRLGIYNPGFTSTGGGYCNLEIFTRYTGDRETVNVCLLNEGTFHQYHGGVATSKRVSQEEFQREYEEVVGKKYSRLDYTRFYF